ncbi:hypothetical protein [uncultured Ruminococcus sp.]|uniref:hypothetical protein n=1 Tax=uncultured Ruminococcus sp. TaxID=165186 RepID=UPI0028039533|nr:hypothetical protein [uncultured Ruminococcus sp.]
MSANAKIIFCDSFQQSIDNGKIIPSLRTPITSISPYAVPGNFSFCIYCSVSGLSIAESKSVELQLVGYDNEIIFTTSKIKLSEMNLKAIDDMYRPLELAVDLRNVLIMKREPLVAKLFVNEKIIASEKLTVKSVKTSQ